MKNWNEWLKSWYASSIIHENLFVIEGHENSGKSSVCELLKNDFLISRLPGGTEGGEKIRNLLKDRSIELHPTTEYFLMCASDAEFFWKNVTCINKHEKILMDRGWVSRILYQGEIYCVPKKQLINDLWFSHNGLVPKKTVVLTCSEETLKERLKNREQDDWFDSIADVIRKLYTKFCKECPEYVHEICTDNLTIFEVAQKVKEYLLS